MYLSAYAVKIAYNVIYALGCRPDLPSWAVLGVALLVFILVFPLMFILVSLLYYVVSIYLIRFVVVRLLFAVVLCLFRFGSCGFGSEESFTPNRKIAVFVGISTVVGRAITPERTLVCAYMHERCINILNYSEYHIFRNRLKSGEVVGISTVASVSALSGVP